MMAKTKPMDIDEEKEERARCGMLKKEIEKAASAIRTQKQKSSELSGDLSGKLNVFEKQGGHKSALKTAERIAAMEPTECADWMRAFNSYFDALGGNDQLDMFVQMEEQDKNNISISVATKQAAAMPQRGEEPAVH